MKKDKIKLRSIKIGLVGDSAVGKTAIADILLNIEFREEMCTTASDKYETKYVLNNGNEIKLVIFDTVGQERFRSIALSSMKSAKGIVLVFDVTNYNSFINLGHWLKEIS